MTNDSHGEQGRAPSSSQRPGHYNVYIAGPLGFSEYGRDYHDRVVIPGLLGAGFASLDPWGDPSIAGALADAHEIVEPTQRLEQLSLLNEKIGARNADLLDRCHAVLAVLDGADVDSGTASEIGYAAAIGRPVVGIRTDFRWAGDNEATPINLQIGYFIRSSGGTVVRSLDDGISALLRLRAQGSLAATVAEDPA